MRPDRFLPCLSLALAAALTACGGGPADPAQALDQGKSATQTGDHAAALGAYQDVLGAEGATAEQKFSAQAGLVVAEAYVNGDAACQAAFDALQKDHGDRLTIKGLEKLGMDVASSGCTVTAAAIVEVGNTMAGEDEEAKKGLQRIADLIASTADADSPEMQKLRSLGYIK